MEENSHKRKPEESPASSPSASAAAAEKKQRLSSPDAANGTASLIHLPYSDSDDEAEVKPEGNSAEAVVEAEVKPEENSAEAVVEAVDEAVEDIYESWMPDGVPEVKPEENGAGAGAGGGGDAVPAAKTHGPAAGGVIGGEGGGGDAVPVAETHGPAAGGVIVGEGGGGEVVNGGGEINGEGGGGEGVQDGGDAGEDEVGEEEEEEEAEPVPTPRNRQMEVRRDCPYLDTVNRQVLDFDFEKFCSISLSNLNVYACLVCGKYYQGRGLKSHAYTHSLEAGHHVYINLQTEKVYCLPDGYEINDPSLDDIRHVLYPRFTRDQVLHLDENRQWSRALDGSNYLPGMVGLNNIKETDFVNVTIQSLMRVTPLRNFFLVPENYQNSKSQLVQRFGELTRKIWHARNFKGQVSPHEFLQAVMKASDKRFQIGVQSDPVEFMSWLLNTLHAKLRHSKKKDRSIIYDCFQGELEVVKERGSTDGNIVREVSTVPFLMLGLDLPPPPLFKDTMEKNIIPQVPLFNILKKFDGELVTEVVRPSIARMRYRVTRLPKYMILHMRRFTKNNFFMEKNPTLVNFPVKNLELKDYIPLPTPKENKRLRSKYDLIANMVHDGKPGEGCYRVFVQRKSEELWYEMQDLHVIETLPQMVALSEAYMQIYEQQE